jgi:hypothetical protein
VEARRDGRRDGGDDTGRGQRVGGGSGGAVRGSPVLLEQRQSEVQFDQVITGVEGVWDYATVPANVRYVSALPGVPINTAWANVKVDYGGAGDGLTDDSAAVAAANTGVSTGGFVYFQPGTYLLSANTPLSSGVSAFFDPGAKVKPASGKTFTMTKGPVAGPWQIFDTSAGGAIAFTVAPPVTLAEWFGTGAGALSAAQAAVEAAGGGIVQQGSTVYNTTQTAGRIKLVTTNGQETTDANLTTTDISGLTNLSSAGVQASASMHLPFISQYCVPYLGASGLLQADSGFTFGVGYVAATDDSGLVIYKPGSSSKGVMRGLHVVSDHSNNHGTTGAASNAITAFAHVSGANDFSAGHLVGVESFAYHDGTGTLGTLYALNGYLFSTGGGIVTQAYGLNLNFAGLAGATVGQVTGILIGDMPAGTGNYSIHTGTAPSWFNAQVDVASLLVNSHGLATGSSKLLVTGTQGTGVGNNQVLVRDDSALAAGNGALIGLQYLYSGALAATGFAFKAIKDNGTDGNFAGGGAFYTQNGTSLTEAMRITSAQRLGIGKTTPLQKLHVGGSVLLNNDAGSSSLNNAYFVFNGGDGIWGTNNYAATIGSKNGGGGRLRYLIVTPDGADFAYATHVAGVAPTNQTSFTERFTIRGDTGNVGVGTATPTSTFEVNGSMGISATAVKTANYAPAITDGIVRCDPSAGGFNVALLAPSASLANRMHYIKNVTSSTNTITVVPASGTIDGAASKTITTAYGSMRVWCDGSNWFTL